MYRFRRAIVRSGGRARSTTGVIGVGLILVMLGLRVGADVTGNDPTGYRLLGDSGPSQTPVPSQPPPTQTPQPPPTQTPVPSQPPSTSPARYVNAEPETDTNPVGTQHTIGTFAGDANNQATAITPIRGDILPGSANASQQSGAAEINCVTDSTPGPGVTFPQGEAQSHECRYTGANTGTDTIRVFADSNGNNVFDSGEPMDEVTKTWAPGDSGAVTAVDASPETATNPNGTQHQVSVTLSGAGGPIPGVTPNSLIASNAAGRPAGDVADPKAGSSPNAAASQGNFNVYSCTASNGRGVSTCTFQDPLDTPTGTDTIVFYVNQASGGTAGPDASEPQDAVQKTWTLRREHAREVTIRFRHRVGRLVISGVLSTTEDDFGPCVASQRLKLQRRADDKWVTKARPETNENGRYRVKIRDRRGRYRVIARQTEQTGSDGFTDVCLATRNQRRHRH